MSAIVVVGSVNADVTLHVARIPGPGETVLALSSQTSPGGKGANQACAVARAGARSALVGAVGADAAAAMLVDQLGRRGVELDSLLRLSDVESGGATVLVDDAGENCIVVTGGANAALTAEQVTAGLDAATDVGLVLTQGELSVACVEAAAAWASRAGVRFVHNLAPYRAATAALLGLCDPLVVNEHEAADLAAALGEQTSTPDGLLAALARHCRSVVITLGGDGAVYASAAGTGGRRSERVEVVDTTGAGDAFVGAAAVQHRGAQPPL